MRAGPVTEHHTNEIIRACPSGLAPERLKAEVLGRLGRVVPIDAVWWATADPATLLFTQAFRDGIPADTTPYFVDNEFLDDDVNKWTELAADRRGARTLWQATGGQPEASGRHRALFPPLGGGARVWCCALGELGGGWCACIGRPGAPSPTPRRPILADSPRTWPKGCAPG